VFEALTHTRPYKDPWSFEEALSFIVDNSGLKFDPELVEIFVTHSEEIRQMFKTFPDERT
jgi:HD-GYP domain-containing protein (c-di-GMP phosphodiesterase class II)